MNCCGESILPFEQVGEVSQRVRELAACLAGTHQTDVESGKDLGMLRQACRERFAAPHLIAERLKNLSGAVALARLDEKAQRVVDILTSLQHDRQLARKMRNRRPR